MHWGHHHREAPEGVTAAVHDWRDSMNYSMDRRIEPLVMDSQVAGLEPLAGYLKSDNHVVKIQFSPDPKPPCAEPFIPRVAAPPEPKPVAATPVNGSPTAQPKVNGKGSTDSDVPTGTGNLVPPDPSEEDTNFRIWTY